MLYHGDSSMFFEIFNRTDVFMCGQLMIAMKKMKGPIDVMQLSYDDLLPFLVDIFIKHLEQEFFLASFFKMYNYQLNLHQDSPNVFILSVQITDKPNYFLDFPMDVDSFGYIGDEMSTFSLNYRMIVDLVEKSLSFQFMDYFGNFHTVYIWRKSV